MKLWTAVVAALLVVGVRLAFASLAYKGIAISYFPFLETTVFIISFFAFVKFTSVVFRGIKYIAWSVAFLALAIIFIVIVDYVFMDIAINLNKFIFNYAVLVVDFIAGVMFGFALRVVTRRRKTNER